MKIGDTVMFFDSNCRYARWFYGAIGTIESMNKGHMRVRWLNPGVLYYGRRTMVSDFEQIKFKVLAQKPLTFT
jgi:predicted RNA-binding protein with PUA-like domain